MKDQNPTSLSQLRKERDIAFNEYMAAQAKFQNVISDLPSGLPNPDGSFRIVKAAVERKASYEKFMKLTERLRAAEHDDEMPAGS